MIGLNRIHEAIWAITRQGLDDIIAIASREIPPLTEVEARLGKTLEYSYKMTERDGVATIPVRGPIFRYPNMMTRFSGATALGSMSTDIRSAIDDPNISAIIMQIDSPGGEAKGNSELANMIYGYRGTKPIVAYIDGMGASAAYHVGAAADKIYVGQQSIVGSIGTMVAFDRKEPGEREPLVIVSEQSPDKYHDPESAKGQSKYQMLVNSMAQVFIDDVAKYRGVSSDHVEKNYGKGGVFLGKAAIEAGLADALTSYEQLHAELVEAGAKAKSRKRPERVAATSQRGGTMSGENPNAPVTLQTYSSEQFTELQAKYEASEKARLKAEADHATERNQAEIVRLTGDAKEFFAQMKTDRKFEQREFEPAVKMYVRLAQDDATAPVEGFSRLETFKASYANRTPHNRTISMADARAEGKLKALGSDPATDKPVEEANGEAERNRRKEARAKKYGNKPKK